MRTIGMFAGAVGALALSSVAFAGGNSTTNGGTTPKGKPFIELAGQIIEVQGALQTLEQRVDALIGDVDTLEGQIEAAWGAIFTLQGEVDTLQAQMAGTEDSALSAAIADNLALIGGLEDRIEALEMDLASLEVGCGEGEAIRQVTETGLVCESVGGTFTTLRVIETLTTTFSSPHIQATCPEGSVLTGGGHASNGTGGIARYSRPEADGRTWAVGGTQTQGAQKTWMAYAVCLQLN